MTQPRKSWAVQRASKANRTEAAGGSRINGAAPHSFDLTVGPRVPHCNFRVDDGSITWRVSVIRRMGRVPRSKRALVRS